MRVKEVLNKEAVAQLLALDSVNTQKINNQIAFQQRRIYYCINTCG